MVAHRAVNFGVYALCIGSLLAGLGVTARAQEPKVSIEPRIRTPKADPGETRTPNIRIQTELVQIPVTVTDPLNRFVTGLDKDHFRVYEDKVEQQVTSFASEDAPISVGIVFDTSGSMGSKLQKARQAVAQFLKTANPEDEFCLIEFNERPELVLGFTREIEEVQNRLTFTQSKGRTALLDGIYLAINELRKSGRNPRRALVVISDGGDNSSRYTESEIKNLVRESDVQIYAMGIFEPMSARGRTAEELSGPSLLSEMCEQTGGRHFAVDNVNELPDTAAKIGIELHNQYVLGYTSKNQEKDGKYRRVQVKLVQPKGLPPLRAFWRLGYYAPTQ
jgi:VWFA-related protein